MKRGKKPSMAGIRIEIYECWSRIWQENIATKNTFADY